MKLNLNTKAKIIITDKGINTIKLKLPKKYGEVIATLDDHGYCTMSILDILIFLGGVGANDLGLGSTKYNCMGAMYISKKDIISEEGDSFTSAVSQSTHELVYINMSNSFELLLLPRGVKRLKFISEYHKTSERGNGYYKMSFWSMLNCFGSIITLKNHFNFNVIIDSKEVYSFTEKEYARHRESVTWSLV